VAEESATEPAPSAAAADAPGALASSPATVALSSSDFLDPPTPVADEAEQIFETFATAAGRLEDRAEGSPRARVGGVSRRPCL
jgi:hypothetical protein